MIERFKAYVDGLDIDFCQYRYPFLTVSAILVVLSWVLFFAVGPNWGTDFTGGTEIHMRFADASGGQIDELRGALRSLGLADDAVQSVNGATSGEYVVRISDATFGMQGLEEELRTVLATTYGPDFVKSMTSSAEVSARFVIDYVGELQPPAQIALALQSSFPTSRVTAGRDERQVIVEVAGLSGRIQERLQSAMGAQVFEVLSIDSVGPKVGAELRRQGFIAIFAALGLILVYVAFRFDVEFAPGAVLSIFHDLSLTVGLFVFFGLEFNLTTIGALLTLVGYSLNDTIVIYDRIRENKDRFRRGDLVTLINKSVSETLTRTIATNLTAGTAVLAFLILGGPVLRDFALAMIVGIIAGTYSTIYIASPFIIFTENLKPALSRVFGITDLGPDVGPDGPLRDEDDAGVPVTESEKRRRERSDAEKRDQPS